MLPSDYAWAAGVILAASFIQSFSGFGFALVAVPLLTLRLPLQSVPPLLLLLGMAVTITLNLGKWHRLRDPVLYLLLAAIVPFTYIGTAVLRFAPESILKGALGVGIVAYAVRMLFTSRPAGGRRLGRGTTILTGAASGLLGGMFGMPGPPLVMYFTAQAGGDKGEFRTRILSVLLLEGFWRMGSYTVQGLLTWDVAARAALLAPVLVLGIWSGSHAHHRVSDAAFQRFIACLLLVSGGVLLFG